MGLLSEYTTIGQISVGTVFRYRLDQTNRGPRVKVEDYVCCTVEAWKANQPMTEEAVFLGLRNRAQSGFRYCEPETRIRVIHAEQLNRTINDDAS